MPERRQLEEIDLGVLSGSKNLGLLDLPVVVHSDLPQCEGSASGYAPAWPFRPASVGPTSYHPFQSQAEQRGYCLS